MQQTLEKVQIKEFQEPMCDVKLLTRAPGFNGESNAIRTDGQAEPKPAE